CRHVVSFPTRRSSDLVVAGTTSVGILRRVASTVGVLLPRRGGLEEFACPLHGRRQVRALVEVDILQPSIKLSFVLRRVGLEGIEIGRSTRLNSSHVKI